MPQLESPTHHNEDPVQTKLKRKKKLFHMKKQELSPDALGNAISLFKLFP